MDGSLQAIFEYLNNYFHEFNFSETKDIHYFESLSEDFPQLSVIDELKTFHAWALDTKNNLTHPRTSFRRWMKRTENWSTKSSLPSWRE
jgi:hypothetical protein